MKVPDEKYLILSKYYHMRNVALRTMVGTNPTRE